jgi:putative acetyltransferase
LKIEIRQEGKNDFQYVYKLISTSFGRENEAKLVENIRERNAYIPQLSIVATYEDDIVGHILFSKIEIIDIHQNIFDSWALAPLSVNPNYQKKGIGAALIKAGIDIAKELNFKSIIVLGNKDYYSKFGFLPTYNWNIKAPFIVNRESFMAIELVENGLKNVNGIVKYSKEFDEV